MVIASIGRFGRLAAMAPMRTPSISATCTTMSVPIWPAPASPIVTGPWRSV